MLTDQTYLASFSQLKPETHIYIFFALLYGKTTLFILG